MFANIGRITFCFYVVEFFYSVVDPDNGNNKFVQHKRREVKDWAANASEDATQKKKTKFGCLRCELFIALNYLLKCS